MIKKIKWQHIFIHAHFLFFSYSLMWFSQVNKSFGNTLNKSKPHDTNACVEHLWWACQTQDQITLLVLNFGALSKHQKVNTIFFHKIKKTQHQNPKFIPKPSEIEKKLAKNTLAFNRGVKLRNAPFFVVN